MNYELIYEELSLRIFESLNVEIMVHVCAFANSLILQPSVLNFQ